MKPLNAVWVESVAVGKIAASIPKEEMMGSATVSEHFPTQEISWIESILFINFVPFRVFETWCGEL